MVQRTVAAPEKPDKTTRGGFLRPFGCGWFIREFLMGRGPYGSPRIDPNEGAPQADIFSSYKTALITETALDRASRDEDRAARREGRKVDPEKVEQRKARYLARLRYRTRACRYHSFIVYFSNLVRLGWVEPSGKQEPSRFQEHYPPGPPRIYYRLSTRGLGASDVAWADPFHALYPEA